MRVDKDFKNEFDGEYANASYAVRKTVIKAVAWILGLSLLFGGVGIGVKYVKTNANREIFKQSVTYNEGMLDDLAKYKYEYDNAEDDVERNAIAELVRNRFANYDKSKIENINLVQFLKECGL